MKRILLIAFHFPPGIGYSGAKRTVAFARHLPSFGWQPRILTVDPRAYPGWRSGMGEEGVARLPTDLPVDRVRCLDAGRHLSVAGHYARITALPDRWIWWWPGGVRRGMGIVRDWKPDLIWSTQPIATAHLIALSLHRRTGIPWIADFRDPFPTVRDDFLLAHTLSWIKKKVYGHASRMVFATPSMMARVAGESGRSTGLHVVENGVDEEEWPLALPARSRPGEPLLLLHAGHLYPDPQERDPVPFLTALSQLDQEQLLPKQGVRVMLRASGHLERYGRVIRELGLEKQVELAPVIPEGESLAEMLRADGLLLFQGRKFNDQVPVKLYEYLNTRRPILAMADGEGESARILRQAGLPPPLPQGEVAAIRKGLCEWLQALAAGQAPLPDEAAASRSTRRERSRELAAILDETVRGNG